MDQVLSNKVGNDEAVKAWLGANPEAVATWLQGVTTRDGGNALAAVNARR